MRGWVSIGVLGLAACAADASSLRSDLPGSQPADGAAGATGMVETAAPAMDDGFGNTMATAPAPGMSTEPLQPPGDGLAPDEEGDCGGVEVEPEIRMEVVPGNLLVVFDKSLSMNDAWGSTQKWLAASGALQQALGPLKEQVTVGAVFYPQGPGLCDVATIDSGQQIGFQGGGTFLTAWLEFFNLQGPFGFTPLGGGMLAADQALAASSLNGITNVVVLTDGDPNCGTDDAQVNQFAANWLALGVKTHVVGLPGSEGARTRLDALAAAGGTGTHVTPDDPLALQDKLAEIVGESVTTNFDSCSIGLPSAPPNLDDVVLTVVEAGQEQAVARDLGEGGGWTITPAGDEIILQGLLCDRAQAGAYDKIGVVFGCVDLPPLPPPRPE